MLFLIRLVHILKKYNATIYLVSIHYAEKHERTFYRIRNLIMSQICFARLLS